MKLVHIQLQFQFSDAVEEILRRHQVDRYARHSRVVGRDRDGAHHGSKVYPGNLSVIDALVEDSALEGLIADLRAFKNERQSHQHLEAVVLDVGQAV